MTTARNTITNANIAPRVFLSYARDDGEPFATQLRQRLEAERIPLWQDRVGLEGGRDWWLQFRRRLDRVQAAKTPKCTFFGVVPIDLKRYVDSGIALVECPHCSRTRSLSPSKGVLRFPPHDRRKMQTPVTSKRWSRDGKTDWDVVGAESK